MALGSRCTPADTSDMRPFALLARAKRKRVCRVHDWSTTVSSGLRRDLCRTCGTISLQPVSFAMTVPVSLRRL